MKFAILTAAALLTAGPALAQGAGAMPAHDHAAMSKPMDAKLVEAAGTVKAVNAKAGTITLRHGPIPAMKWPAMTMTFKASPEVLKAAKTGQSVKFTLKPDGGNGEVVAIKAG